MRLTYFLTVCAYLSSTVSADELKHLNRITRGNLPEELVFQDVTTGKEINFAREFYPDIFTLRKPQLLIRNEVFQIPKTIHEFKSKPQQFLQQQSKPTQQLTQKQQQQYHYNRGRSRQPMKRLKVRSIVGTPTFELNDNEITKDLLPTTEVHEEKPIHIEPVLRVTTKKNVLDSIIDIVKQLLYPSKNEPGPIVGPIKIPGSGRKIFLRLLEPLDASHVMVRFVTQLKVPVADLSEPKNPVIPVPPVIDPISALLNPNGNAILSDAAFSSSNRNAVRTANTLVKGRQTQSTEVTNNNLNSVKSPAKDLPTTSAPGSDKPVNEAAEDNKHEFSNTQPNQFPSSYYHYQSADDALKEVNAILNDTTNVNDASKPLQPWYQLTTHRLPLRQIAPLYPLTSMEHGASSPANSYKIPSDPLATRPATFPDSYEQYNSAPGSYTGSYEHYGAPSSYSASYDKPNNVNPTANTYSVPFAKQSEFNSVPYAASYQNQNEFSSNPSSYSTAYDKQPDLYGAPSSYLGSHERPSVVSPTPGLHESASYDKQNNDQTGLSSQEALHVIDPPSYISDQSNQSFERGRQPRYNSHDLKEAVSHSGTQQRDESTNDLVVWGKTKREKSQLSFESSPEIFSNVDEDRKKWESLTPFRESTDAFKDGSELREKTKQQPKTSSRNAVSSTERGTAAADQRSPNSKRRSATATTRGAPRCSNEDGCEQTKPTTVPTLHSTKKIIEKARETVNIEPIAVKSTASDSAEALRLEATISPALSSTTASSTTEKSALLIKIESPVAREISLPLIKATKSPVIGSTERLIAHEALNKQAASKVKPAVNSTTENINSATKAPSSTAKKLQLPKRPVIMKKSTFIMKGRQASGTTTKKTATSNTTQKSTTTSTTKRTIKTKNQGKTKSSTT